MDPFHPKTLTVAIGFASLLAYRASKKKTLTAGGAATGFLVGFLLVATGLRGLSLFVFYLVGTAATKYKKEYKMKRDATIQQSSVRGATQVWAVSATVLGLSLAHALLYGKERPIAFINDFDSFKIDTSHTSLSNDASKVTLGILAHHACCLADTLASELGILSYHVPVLVIAPWKRVPPGTNGGITLWGTLCSAVGGAIMGLSVLGLDTISGIPSVDPTVPHGTPRLLLFAVLCGILGSLLDSILGATIQLTFYSSDERLVYHSPEQGTKRIGGWVGLLNNEQVNFCSALLTAVIGGWILGPMLLSA